MTSRLALPLHLALALALPVGCRPPSPPPTEDPGPASDETGRPTSDRTARPASDRTARPASKETDLTAARALFERNIRAIQNKDRAAYLDGYRSDPRLIRAGHAGIQLGFRGLASATSTVAATWPSRLEASELSVHPVADGVVYGSYRYRVTIDGETTRGWSERLFVRTDDGWKIAVSTAFEDPE